MASIHSSSERSYRSISRILARRVVAKRNAARSHCALPRFSGFGPRPIAFVGARCRLASECMNWIQVLMVLRGARAGGGGAALTLFLLAPALLARLRGLQSPLPAPYIHSQRIGHLTLCSAG
jgi:hypothetical protein